MLKELTKGGLVILIYIFKAILRLENLPTSIKIAQIIMITKPAKNPIDLLS